MHLKVLGLLFTFSTQAVVAYADEMPPQSGVIAMASEPVSVKTTPLKGKIVNRTASTGQAVYLNDEIKTSATSKAQILLKDQSVFNIGPNSTMVIDKFVYDPQKSSLNVSIQKGAFKFVSGKIANTSDEAMKVSLPNATIAVRGTGVAGIVEPNGSATVMLLHGTVDVTSMANNSTSTLSKSGWGVQINPTGVVSPPAPLPADVTRNIMQTSKVTQQTPANASSNSGSGASNASATTTSSTGNINSTASSSAGASSNPNSNSAVSSSVSQVAQNAVATLATPEIINTVTPVAASVATTAPATTSAIQSVTAGSGVTLSSSSTTLAASSSGSFSTAAATASLNSGNAQLISANNYLATAQTQSSNAVSQASSAATQASSAATQATTAATQATAAANPPMTAPESAIRANELAATAAALASTVSTSASAYSSQAASSATNTSQASYSSIQAANTAVNYAVTATQQSNADNTLVGQAKTLTTQAGTVSASATSANAQAASAATSAQASADQATASSLAAASSALSAYQSASTIAQTLTPYETISQTTANSGALNPLGNVTFSTSNIAMSCVNGYSCGGSSSSAIINNHSFVFNFLNSTVTNNYNISYNNFNGYTGTVSGANAATAINWSSATIVSLPVTGQVSPSPVSAAMDVVLSSVGIQNQTKRANLATVYTTISSPLGGGGNAYMGVGNGYKILGK
jgi:hypothetical protein